MNKPVADLFEKARTLTAEERVELAELLLESIDAAEDEDDSWAKEAGRRWLEHVRSGAGTLDALKVLDEARQSLKQARTNKSARKKA